MTANKGEWSELYAALKIFSNPKVVIADENLNPTHRQCTFNQILRIDDPERPIIYDLGREGTVILRDKTNHEIKTISVAGLATRVQTLFRRIEGARSSAFSIPEGDALMREFMMAKIKAGSSDKADLVAAVTDGESPSQVCGFSIKSQVGSPATLLNASRNTNFVYKVENFSGNMNDVNAICTKSKIRDRLTIIKRLGGKITFSHIDSEPFTRNLRMIDDTLPNVLSEVLLRYYSGEAATMHALMNLVDGTSDTGEKKKIVKKFLMAIASGMMPGKIWDSHMAAQNCLIVREDGQLVCLDTIDKFEGYLFQNTKLDTPSSSRHGFGELYQVNGEYFIKLNIQVRFIK